MGRKKFSYPVMVLAVAGACASLFGGTKYVVLVDQAKGNKIQVESLGKHRTVLPTNTTYAVVEVESDSKKELELLEKSGGGEILMEYSLDGVQDRGEFRRVRRVISQKPYPEDFNMDYSISKSSR